MPDLSNRFARTDFFRGSVLRCLRQVPTSTRPSDLNKIPRDYIHQDSLTGKSLIDLFEHRITDYGAQVFHTLPHLILLAIEPGINYARRKTAAYSNGFSNRLVAPPVLHLPPTRNLSYESLNRFDGVLTTASLAHRGNWYSHSPARPGAGTPGRCR